MNNKLIPHTLSTLRIIAISSLTIFTLYTLQAWTGPTQSAPNGNVGGPLTTATSTQTKTGKLIALDFCTIAGKCLSSSAVIPPAATLSGTPASCTIASGASTCNVSLTWNITNATTPNVYNSTKGIQISTLATATSYSYSIGSGANTIQAREGSSVLASITETGSCASGSLWNGSSCAPTTATIAATVATGATSQLAILDNQSSAQQKISWTVSNAVSPNIFNASTNNVCATGIASSGWTNCTVTHGVNSFYVRDGTTILTAYVAVPATPASSVVVPCYGEPGSGWGGAGVFWNGTICDPSWVLKAFMLTPRGDAAAAVSGGKIYVFGGRNTTTIALTNVEEYDPATNMWATKTSLPIGRHDLVAATLDPTFGTKIYVMSGVDSSSVDSFRNDEFSPILNTWALKTPVPAGFGGYSSSLAASTNGKIYIFNTGSTREYSPTLNTWTTKASNATMASNATVAAIADKIYLIGGQKSFTADPNCNTADASVPCSTVEEYNTTTNVWTTKTPMLYKLYGHTVSVANGLIYVFGGTAGTYNGSQGYVQEYNPVSNTWRGPRSNACNTWYGASSGTVNNKIYVMGNSNQDWGGNIDGYHCEYTPTKDLLP